MTTGRKLSGTALLVLFSVIPSTFAIAGNKGTAELDDLDRQEFATHLQKADLCAASHDFDCAIRELANAKKYANGPQDSRALATAAQSVELERQRQMFAAAQNKYADERNSVDQAAVEADREAAASNRASDRMAAYDTAERERREAEDRNDSSPLTPADIITGQIRKNAAEARQMLGTVNRETQMANAQIARANEQGRMPEISRREAAWGSIDSSDIPSRAKSGNAQSPSTTGGSSSSAEAYWQRDANGPKKQITKADVRSVSPDQEDAKRAAVEHFAVVSKGLEQNFASHVFYERLVSSGGVTCTPALTGPGGKVIQWGCNVTYVVEVPDRDSAGGTLSK